MAHIKNKSIAYEREDKTTPIKEADVNEQAAFFGPLIHFDDQAPPSMPIDILPGILGIYSAAVSESI